jgi:hypothetical protein
MPARHIALVPEFGMNPSELARVSAALQKQVTRDLEPLWQVQATVDAFPTLEDVPAGYWPIILTFRALAGESGVHVDRNGQPYGLVEISPSWSLTASHVCLEMVTDPFGSRTFPGPSPRADQGDVEFLGAICDACEHAEYAYLINDVLVSDFCTPAYWDPAPSNRDRRSFTGAIQAAYQVLPGGHLSWYDPTTNSWWLRRLSDGVLSDVEVGAADPERGSVREFMGRHSPHLAGTRMTLEAFEARVGMRRQRSFRASQSRAFWLRAAFGAGRGGETMPLDAEVRSALGNVRPAREIGAGVPRDLPADSKLSERREVAADKPTTPPPAYFESVADASEPAMTVDESVLESEISDALERVQGEIRATAPPPPGMSESSLHDDEVTEIAPSRSAPAASPPGVRAPAYSAAAAPVGATAPSMASTLPEAPDLPVSQPRSASSRRTVPPPLPGALPVPLPPPQRRSAPSEPPPAVALPRSPAFPEPLPAPVAASAPPVGAEPVREAAPLPPAFVSSPVVTVAPAPSPSPAVALPPVATATTAEAASIPPSVTPMITTAASVAPAAFSVPPPVAPAVRPKAGQDNRIVYIGGFAAAALIVLTFAATTFHVADSVRPTFGAAGGGEPGASSETPAALPPPLFPMGALSSPILAAPPPSAPLAPLAVVVPAPPQGSAAPPTSATPSITAQAAPPPRPTGPSAPVAAAAPPRRPVAVRAAPAAPAPAPAELPTTSVSAQAPVARQAQGIDSLIDDRR